MSFITKHPDYFKYIICSNVKNVKSTRRKIYFQKDLSGFYVCFDENEGNLVTVSGSLHKSFKTNNYGDFTKSEIKEAIKLICIILKIEPDDSTVKIISLEFGVNVKTIHPPVDYAKCMLSYVKNNFRDCKPKKGTVDLWGRECNPVNFALKFYDKRNQSILTCKGSQDQKKSLINSLPDKLLRYEVVYHRAKSISSLKNLTSLYSNDFLQEMKTDILYRYDKISKLEEIDFRSMNNTTLRKYFAGLNSEYWEWIRNNSVHSFKEEKKQFSKIKRNYKINGNGLTEELRKKIVSKLDDLMEINKAPTNLFMSIIDILLLA